MVKIAHAELLSKMPFCAGSNLADLQFADLVSQCLSRPGNVAINFIDDVQGRLGGVCSEEVDGLLACPFPAVHSGVDNESDSAPHFVCELPEARIGGLVYP
jgi:hypothetical protein